MHLIAMKGHPATGKSTLARALARQQRWPLIDKDDVKDHTANVPGGNVLAYDILWQIVETQLRLGMSVIADSPLSYPLSYETVQQLANRYGAKLWVVETRLDSVVWLARLEARGQTSANNHRIDSWADMQALLARYDGCWNYEIAPEQHILLDSSQPVEQLVEAVLRKRIFRTRIRRNTDEE